MSEEGGEVDRGLGAADEDVAILGRDVDTLAIAQAEGLDDLAGKADGEVVAPFADGDLGCGDWLLLDTSPKSGPGEPFSRADLDVLCTRVEKGKALAV